MTRFMAKLIERCHGRFKSFLDVGTGSGILSLTALVYGAKSVEALDISRDAVSAAKANFKRNGFKNIKAFKMDVDHFSRKKTYDFVAANLITQELVRLKKKLVARVKKGQYLAISGITLSNLSFIKKAFRTLPVECLKIEKGEGWCALLYKRV